MVVLCRFSFLQMFIIVHPYPWHPTWRVRLHGTLFNDHFVHSTLQCLPQLSPLLLHCLGDLGSPKGIHQQPGRSGTNQHAARSDIVDQPRLVTSNRVRAKSCISPVDQCDLLRRIPRFPKLGWLEFRIPPFFNSQLAHWSSPPRPEQAEISPPLTRKWMKTVDHQSWIKDDQGRHILLGWPRIKPSKMALPIPHIRMLNGVDA